MEKKDFGDGGLNRKWETKVRPKERTIAANENYLQIIFCDSKSDIEMTKHSLSLFLLKKTLF